MELRNPIPVNRGRYITFDLGGATGVPLGGAQRLEDFTIEDYGEYLRNSLRGYIQFKAAPGNDLWAYLIDPAVEAWLETSDDPIGDDRLSQLLANARAKINKTDQRRPVFLTSAGLRGRVRRLIAAEFPRMPVLSYSELSPDMNIKPIARIAFKS